MLDDQWKERIRRTARLLLYAIGVLYLVGLYSTFSHIESDIRSMKSNIDSLESDVSSISDDVSSIQDDVSSIRDDFDSMESSSEPRPVHAKKWETHHDGRRPYAVTQSLPQGRP